MTQTGRRYYLGRRYNAEKGTRRANQHTAKRAGGQDDHEHSGRACERLAKEEGLGEKSVRRAGEFAARLDRLCQGGMDRVRDLVVCVSPRGEL
jgi:hypothetical protein